MTMREKIAYLRNWAETRARMASSEPVESIEEQTVAFLTARAQAEASRQAAKAPNAKTKRTRAPARQT
jgi:hypothetical protein